MSLSKLLEKLYTRQLNVIAVTFGQLESICNELFESWSLGSILKSVSYSNDFRVCSGSEVVVFLFLRVMGMPEIQFIYLQKNSLVGIFQMIQCNDSKFVNNIKYAFQVK